MAIRRFVVIATAVVRFRLDRLLPNPPWPLNLASRLLDLFAPARANRAERLRRALEWLGPVFIKFGQMMSTRPDLIAADIADELARLQDQAPPFAFAEVEAVLQKAYGRPLAEVFAHFERQPIASASIAQVHFARLPAAAGGHEVAVKICRPGIAPIIDQDVALLDRIARLIETLLADGKRLRPREVVAEFSRHLHEELNLMNEAANCAQLGRRFADRKLLLIPEVYWPFCHEQVMVMERMQGTPISQIDTLTAMGIDRGRLAERGVEIFFTQVFRDGFFHADMHPGNILVHADGRYIAVDFGIVAQLNDTDKYYLAKNFLAFFKRDYQSVAQTHIDCGWAPASTRVDAFEAAIRSVCEPIFERPLKDISFGRLLLRLFQTSRQFDVHIQPQLVMLQKTLLNIEGLGRQLDPELDLWKTAKPFLERWMNEQIGWRRFVSEMRREAENWSHLLPQLPRLLHTALAQQHTGVDPSERLIASERRAQRLERWLMIALLALVVAVYRLWSS